MRISGSLENWEPPVKTPPPQPVNFFLGEKEYLTFLAQRLVPMFRETLPALLLVCGGTRACALGNSPWLICDGAYKCR